MNGLTETKNLSKIRNKKEALEFFLKGWFDKKANQPFVSQYDTWKETQQKNYENGRLAFLERNGRLPSEVIKYGNVIQANPSNLGI